MAGKPRAVSRDAGIPPAVAITGMEGGFGGPAFWPRAAKDEKERSRPFRRTGMNGFFHMYYGGDAIQTAHPPILPYRSLKLALRLAAKSFFRLRHYGGKKPGGP